MNPQISQIAQKEQERDPRTHALIGAAMEVHRQLGCGFLEAVYQNPQISQINDGDRRNAVLGQEVSRVCGLQSVSSVQSVDLVVGLLLNFGSERLQYKRFVFEV